MYIFLNNKKKLKILLTKAVKYDKLNAVKTDMKSRNKKTEQYLYKK